MTTPTYLAVDVETVGLLRDNLAPPMLEIAWAVVDDDFAFVTLPRSCMVVLPVGRDHLISENAESMIAFWNANNDEAAQCVLDMHEQSGLLAAWHASPRYTTRAIDAVILADVAIHFPDYAHGHGPTLLGSSPAALDLPCIRAWLPNTAATLSHRLMDDRVVKRVFGESHGYLLEHGHPSNHRAADDLRATVATLKLARATIVQAYHDADEARERRDALARCTATAPTAADRDVQAALHDDLEHDTGDGPEFANVGPWRNAPNVATDGTVGCFVNLQADVAIDLPSPTIKPSDA